MNDENSKQLLLLNEEVRKMLVALIRNKNNGEIKNNN